jgi:hypothetical protein
MPALDILAGAGACYGVTAGIHIHNPHVMTNASIVSWRLQIPNRPPLCDILRKFRPPANSLVPERIIGKQCNSAEGAAICNRLALLSKKLMHQTRLQNPKSKLVSLEFGKSGEALLQPGRSGAEALLDLKLEQFQIALGYPFPIGRRKSRVT